MKYWEDFRSTHGFEGGNEAPQGIEEVARFYCEAINKLAHKEGSNQRADYIDHNTINNVYRICIHDIEASASLINDTAVSRWDDAMYGAIDTLRKSDIDEHIRVYIDVLDSAEDFLESL